MGRSSEAKKDESHAKILLLCYYASMTRAANRGKERRTRTRLKISFLNLSNTCFKILEKVP